jgi:hypothetical protein
MSRILMPSVLSQARNRVDFSAKMLLTSIGTGLGGVGTMIMEVSDDTVLTLTGDAVFTDSAGVGTDKTYTIIKGAVRTFYIKLTSGTADLIIADKRKLTKFGNNLFAVYGWASPANSLSLTVTPLDFPNLVTFAINNRSTVIGNLPESVTWLAIIGNATFVNMTELPSGLLRVQIGGAQVTYSSNQPIPLGCNYLLMNGSNNFNWTALDVSGTGNIQLFSLVNHRINKMTDSELVKLLTSMKDRQGGLPATCSIGDYDNWDNVPEIVTERIAQLKLAKPNISVVNLTA